MVLLATRTLKAERDSFSAQLDRNSARVRDAKAAADEADAALKAEQEANRQRFRQSEKRIEELSKRRAAPNDEAALSIIREDSKAPWDGWK